MPDAPAKIPGINRTLKQSSLALALGFAVLAAGCAASSVAPAWQESRAVHTVAGEAHHTLSVPEGMVFVNGPDATRGIRFLPGVYALEAEDADYWYFRSPSPVEFRAFHAGKFGEGDDRPGGLMIAKKADSVPAAGYTDGPGKSKLAVWKLGQEFLQLENKYWIRNF